MLFRPKLEVSTTFLLSSLCWLHVYTHLQHRTPWHPIWSIHGGLMALCALTWWFTPWYWGSSPSQHFRNIMLCLASSFYCYLQIYHLAGSLTGDLIFNPLTDFERLCKRGPSTKGLASQKHRILVSLSEYPFLKHAYMTKWEEIIGIPLYTWKQGKATLSLSLVRYSLVH